MQHDRTSLTIDQHTLNGEVSNGEAYIMTGMLVQALVNGTHLPLSITGDRTATLRIGNAALTLGTPDAPVFASSVYNMAIGFALDDALRNAGATRDDVLSTSDDEAGTGAPTRLRVTTPTDGQYAILSTTPPFTSTTPRCGCAFTSRVRTARHQQFTLLGGPSATQPCRMVSSFAELVHARRTGQQALLVLQLNPSSDLRTVVRTAADRPLPATQVQLSFQR